METDYMFDFVLPYQNNGMTAFIALQLNNATLEIANCKCCLIIPVHNFSTWRSLKRHWAHRCSDRRTPGPHANNVKSVKHHQPAIHPAHQAIPTSSVLLSVDSELPSSAILESTKLANACLPQLTGWWSAVPQQQLFLLQLSGFWMDLS